MRWLIKELRSVSPGNLRALWLPYAGDSTTNTLKPDSRTWTSSHAISGRLSYQGNGLLVTFNGTTNYSTTPDTADMRFGDGAADSAFSAAAFASVTDTANVRTMVARAQFGVSIEWDFRVDGTDALQLLLTDFGTATCNRKSDAVIAQGSPQLFGFSYTGAGGATAANGITLYANGASIASTATNSGAYVSMNGTAGVVTAVGQNANDQFFAGSIGLVAVYAGALTAAQHMAIRNICTRYYGVAL